MSLFRRGHYVWRFKKGFDIRVGKEYPDTLQEPAKSFFMTYAYQNPQTLKYVLCADDARFCNHSDMPNTHGVEDSEDEDTATVASRDIRVGEEITADYREFDTHPFYGFDKANKERLV